MKYCVKLKNIFINNKIKDINNMKENVNNMKM